MVMHVINFIPHISIDIVKVGVIVFPGSNCDRDMYHVLTDVFNLNTQYFWHEKPPGKITASIFFGKLFSCQKNSAFRLNTSDNT